MFDVPLNRAQRMFVIHVHVVEALHLAGLRVFDERTVGSAQITETALPRWLHALGAHLQDLLLRGRPGQGVAGHITSLPSTASHICAISKPLARKSWSYLRESGVFQPKCQIEVCGPLSSFCGGVLTLLKST